MLKLGLINGIGFPSSNDPITYYGGVAEATCCTSVWNIDMIAGLGVVGGK
jgi:hypothetical protein